MLEGKEERRCDTRKAHGELVCAKCKQRTYCSKKCQREHWNVHKLECGVREKMHLKKMDYNHDCFEFESSRDGKNTNLLILLCGLGDSAQNFLRFGKQLTLPQTALLSLQGEFMLGLDMGSAWFPVLDDNYECMKIPKDCDDADLTSQNASDIRTKGLNYAVSRLKNIVHSLPWKLHEIFLLGHGHGGIVALQLCLQLEHESACIFAGVIAINGCILPEQDIPLQQLHSPLLISCCLDQQDDLCKLKQAITFDDGELECYQKNGFMSCKRECDLVMKFFGKRLKLRMYEMEACCDEVVCLQ